MEKLHHETAVDTAVTHRIWEAQIPLQISLSPDEIPSLGGQGSANPSISHYLLLHRCSYLSLISSTVRQFFARNARLLIAQHDDAEIWYSYKGTPLKWHHPVGLLCDYHLGTETNGAGAVPLPWYITVHFSNFPTVELIRMQPKQHLETARDSFMSLVKEADYLRNGTIKRVMGLSKNDQTQLWDALVSHNYNAFWDVNSQLVTQENSIPKYIPLRIHILGRAVIQEPVPSVDDNLDKEYSLHDVLGRLIPDVFGGGPEDAAEGGFAPSAERKPAAILHGIVIPLDTPILWLSRNCSYPDGFLHFVVRNHIS
ncbi:autophagy protein Apg5-domain-containing protein [Fimicolochytrium jonesii]|uniref:autophagy protein Apg5-domain-containing protein n=1 Tax=Fimicolochytrium jonesii TaxID=1396493 RepID=UPI0022FE73F5|nr:autophagy protein Apg5-domain-containing protein [Fimicolochytrium jonesii]KAI8823435.1 autophagy protein Apg5-domain-containing protein [Fimicolochytrium jonesii]